MDEQRAREWLRNYHGDKVETLPPQEMSINLLCQYLTDFAAAEVTEATRELQAKVDDLQRQRDFEWDSRKQWRGKALAAESALATEQARVRELEEALPKITRNINEWVHGNVERSCLGIRYYPGFSNLDVIVQLTLGNPEYIKAFPDQYAALGKEKP